jgi:pyruvate dehydrogenase E2 component (dihydrolipoamide acetyltransferase)
VAKDVIMPKMGQTVEEVKIIRWLVGEGATVERDQPLAEVETDKAVFELESPAAGVLRGIRYGKGAVVPVLETVAVIAAPGEAVAALPQVEVAAAARPAPAAQPPSAGPMPSISAPGPLQPPSRVFASPRARRLASLEDVDLVKVTPTGGRGIRVVERDVRAYLAAQPRATPVARRVAEAAGLDLRAVAGTGVTGRILKEDVMHAARTVPPVPAPPGPHGEAGAGQVQAGAPPGPVAREVIPVTGVRRIIAERMAASLHTTAQVTLTTEADATELVAWREFFKENGLNLSYNDLLIKIVARALREYPYMNATLVGEEIYLLETINIGLAVDTARGLLVPVVRDADKKGLAEIAEETAGLAERAQTGKSLPDELTGGTFTITNLGMYDIDAFTPIINLPECALLGVGRIAEVPVVHEGQVCIRKRMVLSLSFDHRLVDGAPAARFLRRVKELIEKPRLLVT